MGAYVCGVCHRPLSKEESVRRGMGNICYNKQFKAAAERDMEGPLGDHFATIISRFIRDAKISEEDAKYWDSEAEKAIADQTNGKSMAAELAYEAVHWVLSGKCDAVPMRSSVARDISNMFDLAGRYKEGEKQEKSVIRFLNKKAKVRTNGNN